MAAHRLCRLRVARLGTLPVLARSSTSSDTQAGTRDCGSLPRVEASPPDRGTLPLRAGRPRRAAGRPVNYRSRCSSCFSLYTRFQSSEFVVHQPGICDEIVAFGCGTTDL